VPVLDPCIAALREVASDDPVIRAMPDVNGTRVISMIASRNDGRSWLLDPQMMSFSVGWAYQPGGAGQYECAVLKVG
jgi:hypothetical protein